MTRITWNELKQLIKARLGDGSRPCRTGLPRFRGQFEQLETRTVLSATIGVMAVDFEASTIAIAIWELRPHLPEPPQFVSFNSMSQFGEASFDGEVPGGAALPSNFGGHHRVFSAVNGGPAFSGGPEQFGFWDRHFNGQPLLVLASSNSNGGAALDPAEPMDPFDFESLHAGNDKGVRGPQHANYPDPNGVGATDTGQVRTEHNWAQDRPKILLPPREFSLSFPSFSTISEGADTITLSSSTSFNAHDAAFDDYSPESLLLAANVDNDADDDDRLGLGDDKRDSDERQEEAANESAVAIAGDAAESLDALEREQAAIDAVLAELHDLNLHQDEQATDSASARDRSKSERSHESSDYSPSTDGRGIVDANFSQADGGMVLLQPTGDANSSAYDLTAVFTGKFARPHDVALGLEATVGLQQAFDVGSNERFDTAGVRTPVAQPAAATAQPSISAENAPAKKSEQPS